MTIPADDRKFEASEADLADHARLAHDSEDDDVDIDPTGPVRLVNEADWIDQQRVVRLDDDEPDV